ncbi:MAG: hypothetical protein IJM80_01135 [Firmicutes bacterium]|nr:hypothetical protein [Bacillota bacterium]
MTLQETAAVFQILQGAYPSWSPNKNTMVAWSALFADEPPEIVIAGVKAFIASDTKGFAPSIGQIKSIIHTPPDQLSESEAWALVRKAIRNGIYGCYAEFDKLPLLVQKVVGDPQQINSWAQLTEGINTVVASNFMRNYRTELERMRMDAAIPKDVKAVLEQHGIGRASIADVYTSALSGHGPDGTGPASNASVLTNFRALPETPQEREV